MAPLCREFGVSREAGYKILGRHNEVGPEGLTDRSRRPYRQANPLPTQIETLIVCCKQDKPSRGDCQRFDSTTCLACGMSHLINRATGKALGQQDC